MVFRRQCSGGLKAAIWSWFLVGSESDVRQQPGPSLRGMVFRCGEANVLEAWRLQFGANFFSVQKVTLGTGSRGQKDCKLLVRAESNVRQLGNVFYFPTCQVRVVRFYQSCSSPSPSSPPPPSPPPPLPPLPCSLPPCQLFAKLFANSRTQWALLDLNCKGLSALGTAGPQPGTVRAQWAPLDLNLGPSELSEHLNLGPSELSEHRWTSTAR